MVLCEKLNQIRWRAISHVDVDVDEGDPFPISSVTSLQTFSSSLYRLRPHAKVLPTLQPQVRPMIQSHQPPTTPPILIFKFIHPILRPPETSTTPIHHHVVPPHPLRPLRRSVRALLDGRRGGMVHHRLRYGGGAGTDRPGFLRRHNSSSSSLQVPPAAHNSPEDRDEE